MKVKVDIYFDSLEGLQLGECEIVTKTQSNPYGNWKYCVSRDIEIEVIP